MPAFGDVGSSGVGWNTICVVFTKRPNSGGYSLGRRTTGAWWVFIASAIAEVAFCVDDIVVLLVDALSFDVSAPSARDACHSTPTATRREGWVFDEKVDGWRMVAYKDDDHVQLVSRNGVDHTWRFSDVAAAIAKLCARMLAIDGEVAIYDVKLRSRFDWLREPDADAVATPPMFMVFDLLHQ